MSGKWLNLFLRFSGYLFILKQKIVEANSWLQSLPYVFLLLLAELVFLIVSLPLYLIVSPKKLQEIGIIFPNQEKEVEHLHVYLVRRKISLTTIFSVGGIFLLKFVFIGLVSTYLLGAQTLLAATQDWNFNTAGDYNYTAGKIVVTGGVAQLVDQGTGGSCGGTATACNTFVSSPTCVAQAGCAWNIGASGSTTNPGFNLNSTGWTYADWLQPTQTTAAGVYKSSGGNPGGYIDIGLSTTKKNKTIAGLWRQSFSTTVNSPSTATLNFDWKSLTYTAPSAPVTYKLYAFIDTGSGNPTLGQEVWTSGEITGTTSWTSVATINITNKLLTAGTYYLKIAAYVTTPNADKTYNFVSNFDNVQLNWSGASTCSGTATACNTYSASSTCAVQGGCSWTPVAVYPSNSPAIYPSSSLAPVGVTSWNSFAETATKGTGEIYYQLSNDDGITWKYWDGSWATSTTSTNSNTASVINTNISSFSVATGKIMWKAFLSSNGSQQVILDNVAIGYTQNAIPVLQSISVAQSVSSGYVNVSYNLKDDNSDPNNLVNYEYSLTGAFTGEQVAMTPVPTDPAHSGVSGLSTSPAGVAHTFVWNAEADLGSVFSNTVYVRLRANDGIANSNYLASSVFSVDYVNPTVSSVTATQVPANSNVQIGYNLVDDTTNDNLVELQVSADGGSNWDVPVSTVSGDVGATVASGNGKTIIWQAGVDYANQEQNNMLVRVRAKDKYQNQGSYVDSGIFIIDNRAPVIATPTNLLAQPLAGATTVLVGGSFAEGNPNTNNFYIAINVEDYSSAQAGDTDTATPSDKSLAVGTTLKGSDYISKIKIEHTDDYGHLTVNENTSPNSAYQYVKPYTPVAPSISNPTESTLDLAINKNPAEVDGLEYTIWESTQNLYVQSDGSLSSSPYWQTAGIVTVTGLSQPISQYSFQVKSRNSSDASHAVSSESDFSSGAASNYQSPQVAINSVAQTTNGTKYVVINYTGIDYQSQTNNLVKYEYSLNGTDWQTMTEKSGVGSAGTASLPFTSGGAVLTFAWDVGTDLASVEDTSVYVRLQSNDAITNSNMVVSGAFTVNTAGPVISNIQVNQTSSTDNVVINYDLADGAGANNTVVLVISDDSGATYDVVSSSISGDVGNHITAGLVRNVVWNAGINYADQEKSTMKIKITAIDSYGNEGAPLESADFSVDTKAPVVSSVVASQVSGSALVTVNYGLADLSLSNVEFAVSANSGSSWTIATTTYTGDMGPGQTAGAKTFNWNAVVDYPDQELDTMRIRVCAVDAFGHLGICQESADFSVNTKMLSISDITAEQTVGSNTVIIHYDLNKNATIHLDISADGGTNWEVATTTLTGQVNTLVSAGNNKTINWNPGIDFNNEEKSAMRVRLSGVDAFGIVSTYYESGDFSVDTASPLGLLDLSKFASTETSVTMNWSVGIADAHFNHYELWHGANQSDVVTRSGTAQKWSTTNDGNLNAITTISTVITGLSLTSDYYVKIWAVDDHGNEITVSDVNVYTAPTLINYYLEIQPPAGFGSTVPITGSHAYLQDTNVQITATASTSWAFAHWLVDGAVNNNGNPLTLLMNATRTLKAIFIESTITTTTLPTEEDVVYTGGAGALALIDTTPPAQPILSPVDTPTNLKQIKISGLAEVNSRIDLFDNGVLVSSLNNLVGADGQFSQTITLTEGEHVLTVKAIDSSNNISVASDPINLSITSKAPMAPIVLSPQNDNQITAETPTLVGVADPFASVEIVLDGKNKSTVEADKDGAWQFKLPTDLALTEGSHKFVLTATDLAGNISPETTLTLNKVVSPVELTPEQIANNIPVSQQLATGPAIGLAPVGGGGAVSPLILPAPLSPAELVRENIVATELAGVPVPEVTNVDVITNNNLFTFTGKALPGQEVLVYVHSDQALIYRTKADASGIWQFNHSQTEVELTPGQHTIYAVAVDPAAKVKSKPSLVSIFNVQKSWWVSLYESLSLKTTIYTLVIILLTMIWLYRIKKRTVANA